MGTSNPRRSNGSKRSKLIAIAKSRGEPCWICGRPIDLSLPPGHPMSFELDEFHPVSRWREFGYQSARACALDPGNARLSTHRVCNCWRGNKTVDEVRAILMTQPPPSKTLPTRKWV